MESEVEKMADNVNHPVHYADTCSMECIETMLIAFGAEAVFDFCICNAYKYLWRHKHKNGEEDLNKAKWYINKAEEVHNLFNASLDENDFDRDFSVTIVLREILYDKVRECRNE